MRALYLLLLFTVVYSISASAQVELGVFGGIANYQGDLVDKPYQSSKGAFELSLGYRFSPRFAVRGGLAFAKVAGADSLSQHADLRLRNLSFQSPITEASIIGEFSVFSLDQMRWTPYVFAGVGLFVFNPYAYDQQGHKVYLQQLGTEGEGLKGYPRPYSRLQYAIPFGGGVKYRLTDNIMVGLEVGLRKTSTDYLDDVSGGYAERADLLNSRGPQAVAMAYRGDEVPGGTAAYPAKGYPRGNPKSKDYYYFTGIRFTFVLPGTRIGGFSGSGRGRGIGCPSVPL